MTHTYIAADVVRPNCPATAAAAAASVGRE